MNKLSNLVSLYAFGVISSSAMDANDLKAINGISVESDDDEITSIRKGAWSSQEDSILTNYISIHGEGRWNHLACNSGLKRTGKSCRLRWKNYLQPNVRRGNFTLEEQLRIIELHCLFGNRWSKMAEFLPGRTDNEIKNYWRTRVQKQAKQLKYDINSAEFREFIRNVWLPRLSRQIHASKWDSNLVHVIMNSDGVETINGPEPLQMDYWASLSRTRSSDVVEAHQFSIMDELSELDFGQGYPFMGYGVDGIDNPAWFNSVELSDMLQTDDIYF